MSRQGYKLKHNPNATLTMYCGLGIRFNGEPDHAACISATPLCYEIVAV